MAQNPHRHRRGECRGHGEPGRSARERRQGAAIARLLVRGLRQSTTQLAQQEPRRAASGQKSPRTPALAACAVQNSPSTPALAACAVQNSPCSPEMAQFGAFSACRESFMPFSPPRSPAGRVLYRTRGRVAASHDSTPGPTGVEGGGRPGCGARGWWRGLVQASFAHNFQRSFFETAQKRCYSNEVISMFEQVARELRAKLMRERPVGGGRAWPGFETTRRAKLAARAARGRAAAHGHTKQPGPTRRPEQSHNTQQGARSAAAPRAPTLTRVSSQVELDVAAGDGLDQLARVVLNRVVE